MTSTIDRDAAEFGVHAKQGGWRLGLLVARNVEPSAGQGRVSGSSPRNARNKVSANHFAHSSTTSVPRVMRHFTAWENAAEEGVVPHAAELVPGQEIDLDAENLPDWSDFYPPGESNLAKLDRDPVKRERYQESADEEGTTVAQVARVAASPQAVAAAIQADPKVALAAVHALDKMETRRPKSQPREASKAERLTVAVVAGRGVKRGLRTFAEAVSGQGFTENETVAIDGMLDEFCAAIDMIRAGVHSGNWDDELAALLRGQS